MSTRKQTAKKMKPWKPTVAYLVLDKWGRPIGSAYWMRYAAEHVAREDAPQFGPLRIVRVEVRELPASTKKGKKQ